MLVDSDFGESAGWESGDEGDEDGVFGRFDRAVVVDGVGLLPHSKQRVPIIAENDAEIFFGGDIFILGDDCSILALCFVVHELVEDGALLRDGADGEAVYFHRMACHASSLARHE